jgi:hypothetical protein
MCALLAGCGGSSKLATSGEPNRDAEALAFSKCMRAHGVSGFPDPGVAVGGSTSSIGGDEIPASINQQSPAFTSSMRSCQWHLTTAVSSQGKPPITAAIKASLIAHAQCMRKNGVPTYPDPTFPATGGIAISDAGTDPQSPAYLHAQRACHNR